MLLELGYALKALGSEYLIMVFNSAFGKIEDLPFDLRNKRVTQYNLSPDQEPAGERQRLTKIFYDALGLVETQRVQSKNLPERTAFASDLARQLINLQLFGNEVRLRRLKPWIEEIQQEFAGVAKWLRANSHDRNARETGVAESMERLVELIDQVRNHVHPSGGIENFAEKINVVVNHAAELLERIFAKGNFPRKETARAQATIDDLYWQTLAWVQRTTSEDFCFSPGYKDFLEKIPEIGMQLAIISYYPIPTLTAEPRAALRRVGETLHLVDLEEELRGPRDRLAIVNLVTEAGNELAKIVRAFS